MAPKTATPAKAAAKTATATKAAAANRAKRAKVLVPTSKVPSLNVERLLWSEGHRVVVGVDEVGRGAWAGPLMVGAAVLPQDRRVYKVRDSKMLSEAQRERLFDRVAEWCVAWAVGGASQVECDELGMAEAQRVAARRAIEGLGVTPDQVLVDGNWDFVGLGCTRRIVKGDITCLSISAASILAKVTRDRVMRAEAPHFPAYDFDSNKGYPCPRHKMALQAFGPTAIHRRTWVFMDHLPWTMRVYREAQQALFEQPAREVSDRLFSGPLPQVDPWGGRVPVRR
jgi:ribonuclease HII